LWQNSNPSPVQLARPRRYPVAAWPLINRWSANSVQLHFSMSRGVGKPTNLRKWPPNSLRFWRLCKWFQTQQAA
jgi:hypothetical protein